MMLPSALMTNTNTALWWILAALSAAACATTVEPAQSGATTTSTSSGAGGASSDGGGGACSVSLPAGCGCPDHGGAWLRGFGAAGSDMDTQLTTLGALAISPDGSALLNVTTSQSQGSMPETQVSSRLVKLDAAGQVLWDQNVVPPIVVTPDPRDCGAFVAGMIPAGSTELLGEVISCGTSYCPFVARIDAGGALEWVKVYDFGAGGYPFPAVAGVLADGRIALTGPFQGTIDLGNGPLAVPDPHSSGVFVAMLSPAGDALWSRHFTKAAENTLTLASAAVVSPAGDITVVTEPDGPVDFGDGPHAAGPGGLVLASYDPTGALRFGKVIASKSGTIALMLALGSAGRLVVADTLIGPMDFGGGPVGSPNTYEMGVAAFDADGNYLWSNAISTGASRGLAVDAADHVWVGTGSANLAELDSGGALVAVHPLGGSGKREVSAIGIAPGGAPVIAGLFEDTIDLGAGPLHAKGKSDTFVAALAP
jgi:hypothetical protein